ncbi:MAG: DUF1027 domain-containing protein [bacterium]|nr:DUF1027 domain-containing protein [bacterium]
MGELVLNEKKYIIVKDNDGFKKEEVEGKLTEYYDEYDYVVGDWAYGKLRLKGFYDEKNKKVKDFNNIKFVDDYINNNCAYKCKYFIIKRV